MITPIRIPTNALLKGPEPSMSVDEALALKLAGDLSAAVAGRPANFSSIEEEHLRRVDARYGPGGVYRLSFLASTHEESDFRHFFRVIEEDLRLVPALSAAEPVDLVCDNERLPEGDALARFNSNVVQPSLARKLYNPGRHHGYLVYGLGGPKILVSHPFRGAAGELYDVYANSLDVVTSLILRGYAGTFLMFDYLPGLNFEVSGVPAWLVWFSIVAAHSDLVVFVEYGGDFRPSQTGEIALTPDRVQKKVVAMAKEELRWAQEHDAVEIDRYITGEPGSTREDFESIEAAHARPFIEMYVEPGIPRDRLIRLDEAGDMTQYPLDFPVYEVESA